MWLPIPYCILPVRALRSGFPSHTVYYLWLWGCFRCGFPSHTVYYLWGCFRCGIPYHTITCESFRCGFPSHTVYHMWGFLGVATHPILYITCEGVLGVAYHTVHYLWVLGVASHPILYITCEGISGVASQPVFCGQCFSFDECQMWIPGPYFVCVVPHVWVSDVAAQPTLYVNDGSGLGDWQMQILSPLVLCKCVSGLGEWPMWLPSLCSMWMYRDQWLSLQPHWSPLSMLHHLLPSCTLPLQSPHQGACLGMLKHLHSHHLRLQEHTTNGPSTFCCHYPLPGRIPHQQRRRFLSTVSVVTFLLPCVSVISQLGSASPSLHTRTEPAKTGISSLPGCQWPHCCCLVSMSSFSQELHHHHMCRASEACPPFFMMPVATLLLPLSHPTPHTHCLECAWPQGGVHLPIKLSANSQWRCGQLECVPAVWQPVAALLTTATLLWACSLVCCGEGKACCVGSTGGPVAIRPSAAQSVSPAAFLHEFELPSWLFDTDVCAIFVIPNF